MYNLVAKFNNNYRNLKFYQKLVSMGYTIDKNPEELGGGWRCYGLTSEQRYFIMRWADTYKVF